MPVQSHSTDTDIFSYCSNWLIKIQDTEIWNHGAGAIAPNDPDAGIGAHLIGNYQTLRVPSFQRGVEWSFDTLLECIGSKSESLGTIVLGRAIPIPDVSYLLDGLQRFAAFTHLLHRLDSLLFDAPTANNPNPWNLHPTVLARPSFAALRNIAALHIGKRGRFHYNYRALHRLQRRIVASTYADWCQKAGDHFDRLLTPQHAAFNAADSAAFIDQLAAFASKPLIVVEISGFPNIPALLATFLGLNSIRVELTGADVCRSVVVEGLLEGHGSPNEVLHIDNQYNATLLTPAGRVKRGLSPLVKVLEHDWVDERSGRILPALFAQPIIAANVRSEFAELAAWIDSIATFCNVSTYLDFIAQIGDNPYVATMLYYFHRHKSAGTLGTPPPDNELHQLSVAYLRRLLDGGVGDSLPITKAIGANSVTTLPDFLQRVNPARSGNFNGAVPRAWLDVQLNGVRGPQTAKLVFNGCLLPRIRGPQSQAFGSLFEPVTFERGANNWQIDHLIPQQNFSGAVSPGDPYKDSLRNYCPAIGSDNAAYNATDCALKLDLAAANYATYRTTPRKLRGNNQPHPFIDALLNAQGQHGGNAELNNRDWLANNSLAGRCYGAERIQIIGDLLIDRL